MMSSLISIITQDQAISHSSAEQKKRITYSLTKKKKFFYNYLVERENGKAGQIKLSLLKPLVDNFDINNFDYKPEIFPSLESATKAKEIFKQFGITDTDFLVTMSPTHKRDSRRWKIKHFMDTAKYLTEKTQRKNNTHVRAGRKGLHH